MLKIPNLIGYDNQLVLHQSLGDINPIKHI